MTVVFNPDSSSGFAGRDSRRLRLSGGEAAGCSRAATAGSPPWGGCHPGVAVIVWHQHHGSQPWCVPAADPNAAAARREWP